MTLKVGSRRRQPRLVPGSGAVRAVAAAKREKARSDKRRQQAEKVAKELPGSDAAAEVRPQPAMKPMPKKALMPMVVTRTKYRALSRSSPLASLSCYSAAGRTFLATHHGAVHAQKVT